MVFADRFVPVDQKRRASETCDETQAIPFLKRFTVFNTDQCDDLPAKISRMGDADVRRALYEAASALMTRFKRRDKVKAWGMTIARRAGHRRAVVAVARKLAVILHAMWTSGTVYCGDPAACTADVAAQTVRKERKLLRAPA